MSSKAWKALSIFGCALGAALFVVSLVGGCNGTIETSSGLIPMKCHWTFVAIACIAPVTLVGFLLAAWSRTKDARRIALVMTAATLLVITLLPTPLGIGICANAEMGCKLSAAISWGIDAVAFIVVIVLWAKADPQAASKPKKTL